MFEPYLLFGFACAAFGWWGSNTAAGCRLFDNRIAVIPIGALVLGTILFANGLWLFVRR